ncbi:DUF1127 domain-containing protein [Pseudosulfitobacter koreensis]|uniref:DUF1127 domain-containing protein n=1 Tax=Pseudosulfitobacter koreensis TaxID=2968472 RepID=A0ABT1Z478_9RHOB|nr:DUF1127 domain-containing protein [Pseudosulfitobacter koreense]MCR8827931.1 DUF1127 domain-containing protein [Pseudosulfitobacter koreense]
MTQYFFQALWGMLPLNPRWTPRRAGPIRRLFTAIATHLRHQRDLRRLESLPDYLLEDVGLSRSDIRRKARRPRATASRPARAGAGA